MAKNISGLGYINLIEKRFEKIGKIKNGKNELKEMLEGSIVDVTSFYDQEDRILKTIVESLEKNKVELFSGKILEGVEQTINNITKANDGNPSIRILAEGYLAELKRIYSK